MKNIFTKHPNSVGESYIKHFYNALSFSCLLFSLSFKAFVHAILPFMFGEINDVGVSLHIKQYW